MTRSTTNTHHGPAAEQVGAGPDSIRRQREPAHRPGVRPLAHGDHAANCGEEGDRS